MYPVPQSHEAPAMQGLQRQPRAYNGMEPNDEDLMIRSNLSDRPSEYPWFNRERGFGPVLPAAKEQILECRRVTDGWVTVLGGGILLWMLYTLCHVLGVGDSRRLSHGYDYRGRLCGVELLDTPFVYWASHPVTRAIDELSPICIARCPKQSDVDAAMMISYPNRTVTTETLPDGRQITRIRIHSVDVPAYPSRKFGGQYCFPLDAEQARVVTSALANDWMLLTRVMKSWTSMSGLILLSASSLLAVLASFGYLCCLATLTWIICWITSSIAPISLFVGSLYLGVSVLTATTGTGGKFSTIPALVAALDWVPIQRLLLLCSFTGIVVATFLLVTDSHLKQHVRKAAALSQATAKCLWSAPGTIVYPIIGTGIAVCIWVIGIITFVGLLTSPAGVPVPHLIPQQIQVQHSFQSQLSSVQRMMNLEDSIDHEWKDPTIMSVDRRSEQPQKETVLSTDGEMIFIESSPGLKGKETKDFRVNQENAARNDVAFERRISGGSDAPGMTGDQNKRQELQQQPFGILLQFRSSSRLYWSCALWTLSVLWLLEVVHNLTEFIVSLTAAMWYFTVPDIRGKRETLGISGVECLWIGCRYHLGTLQLSAFILSTFRWSQFAAWMLQQRVNRLCSRDWFRFRVGSSVLSCLQGMFIAIEETARFLNSTGLNDLVLHSNDFLPSCRRAFEVCRQQVPSVVLLGRLSATLSLLNSVGLASILSVFVLYISNRVPSLNDPSSNWFIDSPVGLAIGTFGLVAVIARSVVFSFDRMSSTLLYCFLVESQNESGVVVFAPDELRILIEEGESERRLEELQRVLPDRSILSLSMMAATKGEDTLDDLLLNSMKGNAESWKETLQQFKDDSRLYQNHSHSGRRSYSSSSTSHVLATGREGESSTIGDNNNREQAMAVDYSHSRREGRSPTTRDTLLPLPPSPSSVERPHVLLDSGLEMNDVH